MSLSDTALVTLVQAKNFIRMDAAASLHIDAEYVGMGDGEDKTFSLDNTPIEGSLKLYVNGTLQTETTHFSISDADITFVTAPTNNHPITASYDYAAEDNTFESYDDDLLETLINAATKKAEDFTGRAFIQREITETHIGDGTTLLKFYKRPVSDVTSITLGSTELSEWTERLSMGRVYYDYGFDLDYEVEVVYTAGYGATRSATQALVPEAVAAVLMAVAVWYGNRLGVKSENISGVGSVAYNDDGQLPFMSKKLLQELKV